MGNLFEPEEWVSDDCAVEICQNGYIFAWNRGYQVMYRCAACRRGEIILPYYQGTVKLRSSEEMTNRRAMRTEIATDWKFRKDRARELFAGLAEMFMHIAKGGDK